MDRRPGQTFFQRGHADGQQAHVWHCFSSGKWILKRQNHNEVSPHTCQNGFHKKEHKTKCWQGNGEKRTLVHYWWEFDLVQAQWKTQWRFIRKLRMGLWYDSGIHLLVIYPPQKKTNNLKRYMHSNIHSSLIYSCQDRKAT